MRYLAIDESEVMQRLLVAIIKQAVADISSKDSLYSINAIKFIESQYCELMCGVIGIEYAVVFQFVGRDDI